MMDWLASIPSLLLQRARGVAIGVVIMLPFVAITWWAYRREQRRWAVHEQLMAMRQQIHEESMSALQPQRAENLRSGDQMYILHMKTGA
jgi:cbb3-type cytochrome oxidase subunit 3